MANENSKTQKIYGKYIKELPQVTEVDDTDDIIIEDSTPITSRVKLGVIFDKLKSKIENSFTFDSLNKKTIIDVLKDFLVLNSKSETGRALKVYDVTTDNLTYGCWAEGLYNYKGYYGKGAPNDWAGSMLVKQIINNNGEVEGFVKTAFTAECKIYMMRQAKNGTIEQSWKEV